ncbi:PLP-dependent aminotransferase family protein [Nakamurella silvestris]|nr:PLP-dependent aminotransferase family protein [Nakamurella silvestris]
MPALDERLRTLVDTAPPGTRLPSTRALVAEHSVSPLTVQSVIRRLAAQGLVETRPGSGNFTIGRVRHHRADFTWQTTSLGQMRTAGGTAASALMAIPPGTIALHNGYPAPDLLPERLVRSALGRVTRTSAATTRAGIYGDADLRDWFAAEVASATLPTANAPTREEVVITPGGQSALTSIFRALADPGDAIVMESPTYWGAIAAAHQTGLRIVPVARQATAPDPAELDAALQSSGAKLIYAQPHFANPTGALWSPDQSEELMRVVRDRRAFLIEDDWAHDFALDAPIHTLVSDDLNGHVIYVRSLTKSVSPAFRVAGVIARGPALARIRSARSVDDLFVSGLLQAAALDVVSDPAWRTHVRRMQQQLRVRRDQLASAVIEHLGPESLTQLPQGGLNLWVRLPDGTDVLRLSAESRSAGVAFAPGPDWFPTEPNGAYIRLTYSGPEPQRYPEALATIARLL